MALFETTYPPYVPFGSRTLRLETPHLTGTDVAVLQSVYDLMIRTMNPPQGPMGPMIPITGAFDTATRDAVRNIQSYFGLPIVDGVAGAGVYFVYGQGVGEHVTYGGPVYGSRQLTQGMTGGDVTILQNRLNLFRYASIIGHAADGDFGAATAAAVLAFKQDSIANGDSGLTDNSVVGEGTFDATWLYTFAGGRAIWPGRNGFDVVFVQELLKNLGYYKGAITGYYDAATQSAVRAFQTASGIGADGIVGPSTFHQMGLNNPVSAPHPLGLSFPITPSRANCCFALMPTSAALSPAAGSVTIQNTPGTSPSSLVLVSAVLGSPQSYGASYVGYLATLTVGASGALVPCSSSSLGTIYTLLQSTSTTPVTSEQVSIAPMTSTGQVGPNILTGSGSCGSSS